MTDSIRPSPLVPVEVDLRDFQYMELDVRRLRDSRFGAEVSGDAFRAGMMLWCAAWHQVPCGSVPDDDIELANLAGYGRFVKEWKKVRAQALQGFVLCSDGRLYHDVVAEKAMAAWNSKLAHFYERAKDRLRKANKAAGRDLMAGVLSFEQWNERRISGGTPMERADAFDGIPPVAAPTSVGSPPESALRGNGTEQNGTERERNGEGTESSSVVVGAAAPPPAAGAAATRPEPRASRLPADWVLPKAWGDWAMAEYPQWTPEKVRLEGQRFADHWRAKSGADATKRDWLATWRNWCRSDITHRDDPKPNGAARPARAGPMNEADRAAFNAQANAEAKRLLGFSGDSRPPVETIDA